MSEEDLLLLDPDPHLLNTCAQIRHEALPMFTAENTFEAYAEGRQMEDVADWMDCVSEDRVRHFTKIRLYLQQAVMTRFNILSTIWRLEDVLWSVLEAGFLPGQIEFDYGQRRLRQSTITC